MKKIYSLLIGLFVAATTFAVTPLVDGEIYYIKSEKVSGIGARNAQFLTFEGTNLVFVEKTAEGAKADVNFQWKAYAAGTDGYYIQNVGDGKYVTFTGSKVANGVFLADKDDAKSKVTLIEGNLLTIGDFSTTSYGVESAYAPGLVIDVYGNNEAQIGVWDWDGGAINRRFYFMTEAVLDDFEAALNAPPVVPPLEGTGKIYMIDFRGVWFTINYDAAPNAGLWTAISDDIDSDRQKFEFVPVEEGKDDFFYIHVLSGGYLETDGDVGNYPVRFSILEVPETEFVILVFDGQSIGGYGTNTGIPNQGLGKDGMWFYTKPINGDGNSDFINWCTLVEIGGTAIGKVNVNSNVNVYSQNGSIYVKGAEGRVIISSMTGASTVVDAKKPYYVGKPGIYIVRANGEAHKVLVK
jgi:hypothetical protein